MARVERRVGFLLVAVGAILALVGVAAVGIGGGSYPRSMLFVAAGFGLAVGGLLMLKKR